MRMPGSISAAIAWMVRNGSVASAVGACMCAGRDRRGVGVRLDADDVGHDGGQPSEEVSGAAPHIDRGRSPSAPHGARVTENESGERIIVRPGMSGVETTESSQKVHPARLGRARGPGGRLDAGQLRESASFSLSIAEGPSVPVSSPFGLATGSPGVLGGNGDQYFQLRRGSGPSRGPQRPVGRRRP
jgi:hypothetical protein